MSGLQSSLQTEALPTACCACHLPAVVLPHRYWLNHVAQRSPIGCCLHNELAIYVKLQDWLQDWEDHGVRLTLYGGEGA